MLAGLLACLWADDSIRFDSIRSDSTRFPASVLHRRAAHGLLLTHSRHLQKKQKTQPFHSPAHPTGGGPGANGATGMVDDQARRLVEMAANTSRIAMLPPTWLNAL